MSNDDLQELAAHFSRVSFEQGAVLERPGEPIVTVFLPESGMLSVLAQTALGTQAEVGIIGPEGMTGLPLLHGVDRTPNLTMVQIPCRALCIEAEVFRQVIARTQSLHDQFLRYAQVFAIQVAQGSLCNSRFTIEARLARWLLMCHDRADREDLPLTHELLSAMLAVRRAGITTTLRVLENAGALKTRRGGIGIRDRAILAEIAGEAYGVPEAEYERVLGMPGRAVANLA